MARIWGTQDVAYARRNERERNELVGPTAQYYSLNRGKNVDPLYNEPTTDPLYGGSMPMGVKTRHDEAWSHRDPVDIICTIEYVEAENRNPSVRDEGKQVEYDAQISIARDEWECKVPDRSPKEGDVMYAFGEWWDVTKKGRGGNFLDTVETVGFKLEVKSRSQFTPGRKIVGSGDDEH